MTAMLTGPFFPVELSRALVEEGLVPAECRNIELIMNANAALELRYSVFVMEGDLEKFARAFQKATARMAEGRIKKDTR